MERPVPDSVFLNIFVFLDIKSLANSSLTCQQWLRVSKDNQLWKELFCRDFHLSPSITPLSDQWKNWEQEYQILYFQSPQICVQTIRHHSDEVMRVAFSKDSRLMASVSKDMKVCIWRWSRRNLEFQLLAEENTEEMTWNYPRFLQFNDDNSRLIVTGQGALTQKNGAVFAINPRSKELTVLFQ